MEALKDIVLPLAGIDIGDDNETTDSSPEGSKSLSSSECHLKSSSSSSSQSPVDDNERPHESQVVDLNNSTRVATFHYDDVSSDDEVMYCYKISNKDLERYRREVKESEGYDITRLDHPFPGCIQCVYLSDKMTTDLTRVLNLAIDIHNKDTNADIKLLNIINANTVWGMTGQFFVTFEAKDGFLGEPKIYQARFVVLYRGAVDLEQFRLKPTAERKDSGEDL